MQIKTLTLVAVIAADDEDEMKLLEHEFENQIEDDLYKVIDDLPGRTEADISIRDSHISLSTGRSIEVDEDGLEDLTPVTKNEDLGDDY